MDARDAALPLAQLDTRSSRFAYNPLRGDFTAPREPTHAEVADMIRLTVVYTAAVALLGPTLPVAASRLTGGYNHSLIVDDGGVVWGVGRNSRQLGDNTGPDRSLPAPAPNLPPLQAVAAGANFSLFLTSDGTVWCAGGTTTQCGPLGGGAVQPNIAFTGASAVAGALYHVVALRLDGTVWSWGTHAVGLGDGVTTTSVTPVQVQGLTGVTAIATNWYHSLAVTGDGRVWAWGENAYGQLGDGTTTARPTPVLVPGIDNVVAVATARYHSLALRADGSVWAWGNNVCGKLGDGTTASRGTPGPVLAPPGVVQIAGGETSSVLRTAAGEVFTWGANSFGQLGDGSPAGTCRLAPTRVEPLANVVDIAAGQAHALARTAAGEVWTWGNNGFGQLGDGTKVQRRRPVLIAEAGFAWKTGTPDFTPRGGSFSAATNVTLTCATPGATIRYTLDGTEPDSASPTIASGGVLPLAESATLRVRAWSTGRPPSNLDEAAFVFDFGTLSAPVIDRAGGSYVAPLTVTLSGPSGATLRYTLDGTSPTSASTAYSGPLVLTGTATLRARSEAPDWSPSAVTSASYALQAPPPVFEPGGGQFFNDVAVTLRTPPLD
jgi:alpha-tubulin suppressor-like RCC1 family protein